jgi:signal transduction histidine kinase
VSATASLHRRFGSRARSRLLLDAAIAAAALAGSIAQLSHGGIAGTHTGAGELDLEGVLLVTASTAPILVWRRAPRAVFVITAAAAALLAALGYPLALALGPAAALFLLALSRSDDDPWTPLDTGAVLVLFAAYLGASALAADDFPGSVLLHTGLAGAVAWFAGERTRLRHEHVADLAERAVRTEREAERERLLAIAEERARIARDLHDSAGNAINVISVRAGTARLREDPERSQAALAEIEELARDTGAEIDQIVGSLRDRGSSDAVEEPPGLASLETLVARHREAGLDVGVSRTGETDRLDGAADQAAYRILQEALANAARHGTGPVQVELAFGDMALELSVSNPVSGANGSRKNGGHGVIGMRERASLLGGSLDVERANGSFRISAQLPYRGASA